MVAVPETAGVHWKTCSGAVAELPQLPASTLVPLVVPPKVPPWVGRTVGLLQLPASAGARAVPWQAATPSRLQRPSTSRLQARGWPPAPTHAAIWLRHAFGHCREGAQACPAVGWCPDEVRDGNEWRFGWRGTHVRTMTTSN